MGRSSYNCIDSVQTTDRISSTDQKNIASRKLFLYIVQSLYHTRFLHTIHLFTSYSVTSTRPDFTLITIFSYEFYIPSRVRTNKESTFCRSKLYSIAIVNKTREENGHVRSRCLNSNSTFRNERREIMEIR